RQTVQNGLGLAIEVTPLQKYALWGKCGSENLVTCTSSCSFQTPLSGNCDRHYIASHTEFGAAMPASLRPLARIRVQPMIDVDRAQARGRMTRAQLRPASRQAEKTMRIQTSAIGDDQLGR